MEGSYWFFVVCTGSATQDQVIRRIWNKDYEERANFESSSDYDNFTDNSGWSEHRSTRSSSGRISSPANMFVASVCFFVKFGSGLHLSSQDFRQFLPQTFSMVLSDLRD